MNILIRQVMTAEGARWQVCLDQQGVSFRSESEARDFVSVLQKRLRAPHPLPWRTAPEVRTAG
ncbi:MULTISPECIES: hypothetical protein [unclassified Pseudomonas]|uniref:hypothetical protein n=1 Tax=unclassified Pseudomonas TaxID=196821 RepID=UPI00244BE16D|nr:MULTISPECIES: hypothetical protein [unclassified Pseudomonas]MDH0893445.1 hypothetical protein [Pseudomonas sp. GD03875]MDH1067046.1 hypothetical protein [Pseudomonas sp. GD03985]